ncbi:HEPN domain-containing protein [Rheinheimera soli]|uniref:RiboL-PSP-HEPN domain-containing protein n=1 Tax=Rheinheimera soli TaxID=443616 RepID=A0ABU1W145_9GAMM|nr:HEPN domain-containing protein [Rheinheimera soli]MDR7121684.1 hypothetical protein [Rheinheimera soli]
MTRAFDSFLQSIDEIKLFMKFESFAQGFFSKDINEFKINAELSDKVESILSSLPKRSLIQSKVYLYKSIIISLYGSLERYVEDVIKEYLENLVSFCGDFEKLPAEVRKNYISVSLDYLSKTQKKKAVSSSVIESLTKSAIDNLYFFCKNEFNSKMNYDAFTAHTSNFRYDSINDIFLRVGIQNICGEALNDGELKNALCEKNYLLKDTDKKVLESILTSELGDLAQRRNEIAHGVPILDIDSYDLAISRVKLLEFCVKAIDSVVMKSLAQHMYSVSSVFSIGKPTKLFIENSRIGFEHINSLNEKCGSVLSSEVSHMIRVGGAFFAVNINSPNKVLIGNIKSIFYDGRLVPELMLPTPNSVVISLDIAVRDSFKRRDFQFLVV